jgi:drug/metabolite transporter (DMT)-like permease
MRSQAASGIALILLAVLGFALLDSSVKLLSAGVPLLLVVWTRYAMQAVLVGGWLRLNPSARLRPPVRHPRFQVLRGTLLLATSVLAFLGLRELPVAEFTAIAMLAPVFVTLASPWLLKEPVGALRWALVTLAFTGGLLVVRPGSAVFTPAALLPLALAACGAMFQLLTRHMAALEDPLRTHGTTGAVGMAWLTVAMAAWPGAWWPTLPQVTAWQWALMAAAGLFGTFGHLAFIVGTRRAPLPVLMPFTYAQLVFAGLLGLWVFGQRPDGWALAGMALIAASGAVAAWVNVRGGRGSPVAADAALGD